MSWEEDAFNSIDLWSEGDREEDWKSGHHIDIKGNKHKLSEMSDEHLKNTISYFKNHGYDTKYLEEEFKKR